MPQQLPQSLVWREVEPTTPPQVTYGLTEFGRDVGDPLRELFDRITRRLSPGGTDSAVAAGAHRRRDG